jgi:hypothetical protein
MPSSPASAEEFILTGGNRVFESEEMMSPLVLRSLCFLLFARRNPQESIYEKT